MITRNRGSCFILSSPMAKLKLLLTVSVAILVFINIGESRDLRPTEHGLPFQNLPARSPEMTSFFGEENTLSGNKPESPPGIQEVSNDTTSSSETWWGNPPKKNRVRKALLIATVVCGGTGVILLLAAAIMFAVHFYRRRSESLATASTTADNNCVNQSTIANTNINNKKVITM